MFLYLYWLGLWQWEFMLHYLIYAAVKNRSRCSSSATPTRLPSHVYVYTSEIRWGRGLRNCFFVETYRHWDNPCSNWQDTRGCCSPNSPWLWPLPPPGQSAWVLSRGRLLRESPWLAVGSWDQGLPRWGTIYACDVIVCSSLYVLQAGVEHTVCSVCT